MKASALLAVFLIAKAAAMGSAPVTLWSAFAYIWQDVLVALAFSAMDSRLRTSRVGRQLIWAVYWIAIAYTAINIPVGRALSTPLTWPMVRAARGPLADSLMHHATLTNALWVVGALTVATLPLLHRLQAVAFVVRNHNAAPAKRKWPHPATAAAPIVVAIGWLASERMDTRGLDRNVLVTLVKSVVPHVKADDGGAVDWRRSPFAPESEAEDLSALQGIAAGRHIVLVSLESTGAQYLPVYGGIDDLAPHLSALAENALVFQHAYAVYPESIKGLFSILCSRYPAFDVPVEAYERAGCESLASALSRAGYRSGLFHSGRFRYLGMQAIVRGRGYQTLEDAGDIGGEHQSSFGVDEASTVAHMLAWIDERPLSERFFLTYLPVAGHHPYDTPERGPFPEPDELGRYRNAVHYADAALGSLIDGLRQRNLFDSTLFVILGDHGEAFGQHDNNYGHTFFVFDENVRVPFIVSAPGVIHGQTRVNRVVSLLDTAPTVLDLLGVRSPASYQGASMLRGRPRMALFYADYSLGIVGLRDENLKFVHDLRSGRAQMFDLRADPAERIDVAHVHGGRTRWYRAHLLAWAAAQKHLLAQGGD